MADLTRFTRLLSFVAVSLGAVALLLGVVAVSPAEASPSARVMATTQRMSAPTLNATQSGTWAQGSNLSLSCYLRGQAVGGYFSSSFPGGLDDLWYRVSDGWWVADVDIDTGSNAPVTAACAGSTPPSTNILTRAQSWISVGVPYNQRSAYGNQFGTYRQDCSGFVSMAWGLSPAGMSAPDTTRLPNYAHRISKEDLQPGDILLNAAAGNAGHVAIFKAWANSQHTRYISLEENGAAGKAIQQTVPYPYISGHGTFLPYRRN